eukprot:scaffold4233_cov180-Ochromonas_danica.AAC.9
MGLHCIMSLLVVRRLGNSQEARLDLVLRLFLFITIAWDGKVTCRTRGVTQCGPRGLWQEVGGEGSAAVGYAQENANRGCRQRRQHHIGRYEGPDL